MQKKKIQSKTNSINNSSCISKSSTSESSKSQKLTLKHIDEIKKYSMYNGKNVWSPAKISQICLFRINSPNYYDDIINDLKTQYDMECKLLE